MTWPSQRSAPTFCSFKLALDSCPDPVSVKSDSFKITYANTAMLELYPPDVRDTIIGSTAENNFVSAETPIFLTTDHDIIDGGYSKRIETIVDHTETVRIFLSNKARFVDQRGQPCILGVSTDVTLLVERGNRLRRTNELLERYANNAAHDLASPLSSIAMIIQLIQLDADNHLSESTLKRLQDGIGIVAGLTNQVRALLLICKAERIGNLDRERVNISATVDRVKISLMSMLDIAGAHVICGEFPDIACQPSLVEALLQNLIENSLKYRSERNPVIRVDHSVVADRDVFTVTDNGVGLSSNDAARLFAFRSQLDSSHAGTGLGLSMCRNIVELHGGSIWVDEPDGQGASISFTLGDAAVGLAAMDQGDLFG